MATRYTQRGSQAASPPPRPFTPTTGGGLTGDPQLSVDPVTARATTNPNPGVETGAQWLEAYYLQPKVGQSPRGSDLTAHFGKGDLTPWISTGGPSYRGFQAGESGAMPGFNNIEQQATGGTLQSFDTAANRLRERLGAAQKSQEAAFTGRQLGRGFGASGATEQGLRDIGGQSQYALGQGLGQLSSEYEKLRQSGLGLGLQALSGQQKEFLEGQGLEQDWQKHIAGQLGENWRTGATLGQKHASETNQLLGSLAQSDAENRLKAILQAAGLGSAEGIAKIIAEKGGSLGLGGLFPS